MWAKRRGSATQSARSKYPVRVRISNMGTVALLVPVHVCGAADCLTSKRKPVGCSKSQPRQSPEHNSHSGPSAAPNDDFGHEPAIDVRYQRAAKRGGADLSADFIHAGDER